MNKMKVIALSARGGSGKTPTIVKAADLLEQRPGVTRDSINNATVDVELPDILDVLSVDSPKLKVGFASDCDKADEEYWNALAREKCDIIVCAVHVKDKTYRNLKKWCEDNEAELTWINQAVVDEYSKDEVHRVASTNRCGSEISDKRNKLMAQLINFCVKAEIDNWSAQS